MISDGAVTCTNMPRRLATAVASPMASDRLSRDLLKRGFKFVGSTICYAFMQAVGMVNDHTIDCFRFENLARLRARRSGAR